jgi:hypothetical protein
MNRTNDLLHVAAFAFGIAFGVHNSDAANSTDGPINILRIAADAKPASAPATPSNISGKWIGEVVGEETIQTVLILRGRDINLSVYRESGCSGNIRGMGSLAGNTLTLKMKEHDSDELCTIKIRFSKKFAVVTEDHCNYYHGVACDFRGILKKQ